VPEWQRSNDLGHGIFVLRAFDALLVQVIGDDWLGQVTDPQSEE
jgi:hypothetical protein